MEIHARISLSHADAQASCAVAGCSWCVKVVQNYGVRRNRQLRERVFAHLFMSHDIGSFHARIETNDIAVRRDDDCARE